MNALEIHIDWSALGQVAVASLVFGVGIVMVFSVGVTALSRRGSTAAYTAVAGLCFAACAAAVGYGLYLIIPQFH